jgi:hypothetical protein
MRTEPEARDELTVAGIQVSLGSPLSYVETHSASESFAANRNTLAAWGVRVRSRKATTTGVAVRTGCFFQDHIGASPYRNETSGHRLRRRRSGMRRKNI